MFAAEKASLFYMGLVGGFSAPLITEVLRCTGTYFMIFIIFTSAPYAQRLPARFRHRGYHRAAAYDPHTTLRQLVVLVGGTPPLGRQGAARARAPP